METRDLSAAYANLLAVAEAITDESPLAEAARAQVDWVIAHIILSERMLADTARHILNGQEAYIDNAPAMSKTAIATLISTRSHHDRVDMARHNAQEFVGLLDRTPQAAAGTGVPTRLVDRDGKPAFDGLLTWGDIVHARATEHIPGHTRTLTELSQVKEEH